MRIPKPLPPSLGTGPFTTIGAIGAGAGAGRLRRGDIQHPFRGVNSRLPSSLGIEARCAALQLKLPMGARFCGPTAALIMGVPLPARVERDTTTHVAVRRGSRTLVGVGVAGHTYLEAPGDTRLWHGLRLSSPERTWCELAGILKLPDLVAAGDYLIHHALPHTTLSLLHDEVERWHARRGYRLLLAALQLLSERSESRKESLLRVIVTLGGIVGVVANLRIVTASGFKFRGDLAIPTRKVIIEYQSDYHADPAQFRKDMTRKSRLAADGWLVIEVNTDDLDDPNELCARIQTLISSRPHF